MNKSRYCSAGFVSTWSEKIHLGPTLPAFLSPNVKQVLIDNFGIGGISTADEDIAKFLA